MAAIVYQKNKKTGIVYAYESISYWDKEKRQSRAYRKCIGKVESESGKIIPTGKGKAHDKKPAHFKKVSRYFYGATYLFDIIGNQLGIVSDLKQCFPYDYKKILSIAYFLILEDKNPLSRFSKWSSLHKHPYEEIISSQRSSELFSSITEKSRQRFFYLQGKRRSEKEYWAYDITSISSYSTCLRQVKYGKNKEHDPLPQINLALLFGEESNLPFYYRKLSGNISDVKTVKNLLLDMSFLGYKKIKLVMDRGFYSENNVNALYKNRLKFLMGTKVSLKYVRAELDKIREVIRSWNNYSPEYDVYAKSSTIFWNYKQKRPYKRDIIRGKRRMYLHVYYNSDKAVEDEKQQNVLLIALKKELETGKRNPKHEKLYTKYFEISSKRINKVTAKQKVIEEEKKNYGFFVLISNNIKDPITALQIYRNKDLIEKSFNNLKDRLNFRRTLVSSDSCLDGKLFVEFIALIYLSYIKKKMQENNLFKKYTLQSLLDEFDSIECFKKNDRTTQWGEITEKQKKLYQAIIGENHRYNLAGM